MSEHLNKRIAKLEERVGHLERLYTPRQHDPEPIGPQNHAQDHGESTPWQPTPADNSTTNSANPTDDRYHNRAPWWIRMWAWGPWKRGLGFGVGLATIAYAMVTYRQWQDLRDQFTKEQRPYVIARPLSPVFRKDYQDNPGAAPLSWDVRLINYGRSPALNASTCYQFFWGTNAADVQRSIAASDPSSCRGGENIWARGGVIPPSTNPADQKFTTITPHRAFSPEELSTIENTDDLIAIRAFVTYEDGVGRRYSSKMCGMRYASGSVHECNPNQDEIK